MNPNRTNPMHSSAANVRQAPTTAPAGLDAGITRALGQPPDLRIPADFAARTARLATTQPQPRTARWIGWGPRLALGSGALLTVALFALAPHAAPTLTSARFDAELVIFAELGALLLFAPKLLQRD